MFKRVILVDWSFSLWLISFVIFLTIFTGVVIWAARMGRDKRDRLASLPLDDPPETTKSQPLPPTP